MLVTANRLTIAGSLFLAAAMTAVVLLDHRPFVLASVGARRHRGGRRRLRVVLVRPRAPSPHPRLGPYGPRRGPDPKRVQSVTRRPALTAFATGRGPNGVVSSG